MSVPLLAALGAILGSFLNLCISRLPRGESLVRPPSHCDGCGARLRWPDLVPILSYLVLRGRCRTCHASIPLRSLLVEVASAAALGFVGYRHGLSAQTAVLAVYLLVLLLVSTVDLEHGIIPDSVVFPMAAACIGLSALLPDVGPERALIGGAVGFAAMFAIYVAARGGMGGGDVKLAGLIGLAAGFPLVVPALLLAAVAGGVAAVALLWARRKGASDPVPFGPFLSAGAAASLLWGPALMHVWLG